MSAPIPWPSEEEKRAVANLWEVGHEYLVDSLRSDQSWADRAYAAQTAGLFFAAAQSRSLAELVAELRTANLIADREGKTK